MLPALLPVAPVPRWWAGSPLDWPTTFGQWITHLPAHAVKLWRAAGALWWPWAPLLALAVLLGAIAVRLALRRWWRRVTAGGYWVAITPPRTVDAVRWGLAWRHLAGLSARARGGRWQLVRPPLAFEVYADGRGGLVAGLWLPGWVPLSAVAGEVGRAWPGATVHRTDPPSVDGAGAVAGVRLAADSYHPETGWLVDDPRPRTAARRGVGADPDLGAVFAELGDPGTDRVRLLLQVLVRPAPGRRVRRLAAAGRQPVDAKPGGWRRGGDGLLWLLQTAGRAVLSLVEVFISAGSSSSRSRSSSAGRQAPDAVDREAMAEARAKHNDRPHLLAAIRVGASGARRRQARNAAGFVAGGYGEASRWLRPVRLRGAQVALTLRRARRGEWLLLSANELGVLAHLPPDPALYRFDTAALHRPFPGGARRADPETGWTRHGWTTPTTGAVTDDGADNDDTTNNDGDDWGDPDDDDRDDGDDFEFPEAV
jgi:hypothetical protein